MGSASAANSPLAPPTSRGARREDPEDRRRVDAHGLLFRLFFAAVANNFIGATYGWRWMFVFGGLPALMMAFIRYGVHESKKWHEKFGEGQQARPTMAQAFGALFTANTSATRGDVGVVPRVDRHAVGRIHPRSDGSQSDGAGGWKRCS